MSNFATLPNQFFPGRNGPLTEGSPRLPVGLNQPVQAIGARMAMTATQQGSFNILLQVLDGPNKGATGEIMLNLWNSSGDAVKMAEIDLERIAACVGHFGPIGDTAVLSQRPFLLDVLPDTSPIGIEKKYVKYQNFRDIQGNKPWEARAGGAVAQPVAQPQTPPAQYAQPAPQTAPQPAYAPPIAPPATGGAKNTKPDGSPIMPWEPGYEK